MHNRSPFHMLLSVMNQPEVCSSNLNIVFLPIKQGFFTIQYILQVFSLCQVVEQSLHAHVQKCSLMSRNKTDVTSLCLQAALKHVSPGHEAVSVVHPILPPKCVNGSNWCFSVRYDISSATMNVSSFTIVFRSAMGLYALGMSYLGLPSFPK